MTRTDYATRMKKTARLLSTDALLVEIRRLGGGTLDEAMTSVRATLLSVYEEREGAAACDALMDEIGL